MAEEFDVVGIRFKGVDDGLIDTAERADKAVRDLEVSLDRLEKSAKNVSFSKTADDIDSASSAMADYARSQAKAIGLAKAQQIAIANQTQQLGKYENAMRSTAKKLVGIYKQMAQALNNKDLDKMNDLAVDANRLSNELSEQRAELVRLAGTYSKTYGKVDNLAASNEELRAELSRINEELQEQAASLQRAANQYGPLESKTEKIVATINEFNDAINEEISKLAELDAIREIDGVNIDDVNKRYKEHESILTALTQEKARHIARLEEESAVLSRLDVELSNGVVAMEKLVKAQKDYQSQLDKNLKKMKETATMMRSVGRATEEFGQGLNDIGRITTRVGVGLSAFTTVPFVLGIKEATSAAIEFESGLAGVLKTVDDAALGGTSQLTAVGEEMAEGFRQLALVMPTTTKELLAIGEVAGQLGIPAQQIVGFTEIIAEFAESTNVTAEVASKAMAQIANVFGVAEYDFVRFADATTNAIVELGNNFATTESDILSFFQTFAGGAAAFNLTASAALGIATAFKSVRAQTASSSTGIQKTFVNMARAVDIGGESLEKFAAVSQMSAEEFAATWRGDPAAAFEAFVVGLDQAGDSAASILRDIGLGDQRIIREFLKIANASDVLVEALDMAEESFGNFDDAGARATEAARRFATTESQIAIMQNTLNDLGISVGQLLTPALSSLVEEIADLTDGLIAFVQLHPDMTKMILVFGGLVASIGPMISIGGAAITTFAGMVEGVGSVVNALGTMQSVIIDNAKGVEDLSSMMGGAKNVAAQLAKEFDITAAKAKLLKLSLAGIGVGIAVLALSAFAIKMSEISQAAIDVIDKNYEVARSFEKMSDDVIDQQNALIKHTITYEEYIDNVNKAETTVKALTEEQWELARSMDGVAAATKPAAAAIKAYMEIDRTGLGYIANYSKAYLELSNILLTTTTNVEEYDAAVQQLIDTQNQADVKDVFARPEALAEFVSQMVTAGIAAGKTNEEMADSIKRFAEASGTYGQLSTQLNTVNAELAKLEKQSGVDIELTVTDTGDLITTINSISETSDTAKRAVNNLLNEVQKLAQYNVSAFSFADVMLRQAEASGASKEELVDLLVTMGEYDQILLKSTLGQIEAEGVLRRYNSLVEKYVKTMTPAEASAKAFGVVMEDVAIATNDSSEALRVATELADLFNTDANKLVDQFRELAAAQESFAGLANAGLVEDAKAMHDEIIALNDAIIDSYNELSFNIAKIYLGQANAGLNLLSGEALEFAVALGVMSQAEADSITSTQELNDKMRDLGVILQERNLDAETFASAAFLLQQGMADSAEEAVNLLEANDGLADSVLETKTAFEAASKAMSDQSAEAALLRKELIELSKAQDKAADSAISSIESIILGARNAGGGGTAVARELDEMAGSFVGFIKDIQEGETIVDNWSMSLLDSAAAAGASLEEVALLAIATGELSDEQASALLNQLAAQKAIEAIAEAYVSGAISADEAAAAVGTLQDQLAAGEDIDLSQFGVSMVESAETISGAAGSAGDSMKELVDIYKEALFDIVTANNDFTSEAELDLQVELGTMTIDEAEAIKVANDTVEGLRQLFGVLVVDGVPVDAILDVGTIPNIGEFVEEFATLVEQDRSIQEGIEILIGATLELGLDSNQQAAIIEQYIEEVKNGVEDKTAGEVALTMSYALIAKKGESIEDVVPDKLLQEGIEIEVTMSNKEEVDEALREQAELIGSYTGEDNPNDIVMGTESVDEAQLELDELQRKIDALKEGTEIPFTPETTEVDAVIAGFENLTITIPVNFVSNNQVEVPGGGATQNQAAGEVPGYYRGGLVKGKRGIDKILSFLTHGEYVVPAATVRKPGVLDILKSLSSINASDNYTRLSPIQSASSVRNEYRYNNDYSHRRIVNVNMPRSAHANDSKGRLTAGMVGAIRGTNI